MKQLSIYFILSFILTFSCKPKKEDPAPIQVDNTKNSNFNFYPSGLFQLFFVTRISNYNGTKSISSSESLFANFVSGSKFVKAGKVSFGANELSFDSTFSTYAIWDQPRTVLPAKWDIVGSSGYPSCSENIALLPDTFALTSNSPDTIVTTKDLVLTLDKEIISVDSIQVHLYPSSSGNKQAFKTFPSGKKTYNLTSSELSPLSSGILTDYILSIKASKQKDTLISGRQYRFLTIRAIEKSVVVK